MKAVTLMYHDAVQDNRFDDTGFVSAAAAAYKIDIHELKRHFEAVAASRDDPPANVHDFMAGRVGVRAGTDSV